MILRANPDRVARMHRRFAGSIKIGDSSALIGARGGWKVCRRSSGAKGNHLAETAGVWKSAAIRQTSLAPADYLKPPLYTPAPTPTISFPKSVARIIKLVEESSGRLLPSPSTLVRQPCSLPPVPLSPRIFHLRATSTQLLRFSFHLFLPPPLATVFLFRCLSPSERCVYPCSYFFLLSFSLFLSISLGFSLVFSPFSTLFAPTSKFPRGESGPSFSEEFRIVGRELRSRARNLFPVSATPQEVVQLESCTV